MSFERDSESERRIKILEYVRKNSLDNEPKITKSDVMRYMKDVSRVMTTHKITLDLIKEGKIKMIKEKPHSQVHFLTIKEDNEFNKIFNSLSEIENSISLWDKFDHDIKYMKENKNKNSSNKFSEEFFRYYYRFNLIMLHSLLDRINKKIHSEIDSKLLYRRIIELMIKLDKHDLRLPDRGELEQALMGLEYFFSDNKDIKKDPTNTRLVDNLKTNIENFIKQFLSDPVEEKLLISERENQEPNEQQEQQKKIATTIRGIKKKRLQEWDREIEAAGQPSKRKSKINLPRI